MRHRKRAGPTVDIKRNCKKQKSSTYSNKGSTPEKEQDETEKERARKGLSPIKACLLPGSICLAFHPPS